MLLTSATEAEENGRLSYRTFKVDWLRTEFNENPANPRAELRADGGVDAVATGICAGG